jgi:undecaprenyl-diphosphatase
MSLWEAAILGLVQGLTEFLPVSSSGHLVLVEKMLGMRPDGLVFEVAVHTGTLVAILVYFRQRIGELIGGLLGRGDDRVATAQSRRLLFYLILGSIPAGVIGVAFKSEITAFFDSPQIAAVLLLVTGVWLLVMHFGARERGTLTTGRAWWIGCAQAAAILPGISRSGATIATGALLGVPTKVAAEFSFLLSIPAVLGATILEIPDAMAYGGVDAAALVGALVAGITGYWALAGVFAALRRGRFIWFGVYCLAAGAVALVLLRN